MNTGENSVQTVVHTIEVGFIAKVIRALLALIGIAAVALLYLLLQFKGLSASDGMDQAQIGREIAVGNGFSTKNLRPLALQQLEQTVGRIPKDRFPETYQAPLHPIINAIALKFYPKTLTAKIDNGQPVFAADRLIAAVSILFFILSLAITFSIGLLLFDRRVAAVAVALAVFADQFWQFSLSGLPQMLLLFFFSCAAWCVAKALRQRERGEPPLLIFVPLGVSLGLMTLTHPATLWIAVATLVACCVFFRRRFFLVLLSAGICFSIFSLWGFYQYYATKTYFGISPYAFLDQIGMSQDAWMRQSNPDYSKITIDAIGRHTLDEFKEQFGTLYLLLGGIAVAPLFFITLIHKFKRNSTSQFKWSLLVMWFGAFVASITLGINRQSVSPNQFHILFGPIMALYGVAFALTLWNRLSIRGRVVRNLFLSGLFVVTGFPMLIGFVSRSGHRINYPPFVPPLMQVFSTWTQPNEILCSDTSAAVAWYADRRTLLLPISVKDFNNYNDFQALGGPIVGLYLTPFSRDTGFASHIRTGEYGDWAGLILPVPDTLAKFALKTPLFLMGNECLYFSDRIRWQEPGQSTLAPANSSATNSDSTSPHR
jgi:4-amino-4-deoxy-L-arabinose transferase-like glycosyltransferase